MSGPRRELTPEELEAKAILEQSGMMGLVRQIAADETARASLAEMAGNFGVTLESIDAILAHD